MENQLGMETTWSHANRELIRHLIRVIVSRSVVSLVSL